MSAASAVALPHPTLLRPRPALQNLRISLSVARARESARLPKRCGRASSFSTVCRGSSGGTSPSSPSSPPFLCQNFGSFLPPSPTRKPSRISQAWKSLHLTPCRPSLYSSLRYLSRCITCSALETLLNSSFALFFSLSVVNQRAESRKREGGLFVRPLGLSFPLIPFVAKRHCVLSL